MMIKEKMMKRNERGFWGRLLLPVLLASLYLSGCYIPGLGAAGDASELPAATDPGGVEDTYYGKFNIYQVGGGKVYSPRGKEDSAYRVFWLLGDTYYPSIDISDDIVEIENKFDYNIMHLGDGTYQTSPINYQALYGVTVKDQTIFYKDRDKASRPAARNPEGFVSNGELALLFTQHWYGGPILFEYNDPSGMNCLEDDANDAPEDIPPTGTQRFISAGNVPVLARFSNNPPGDGIGDIDVYTLVIAPGQEGSLFVFRLEHGAYVGRNDAETNRSYDNFHEPMLSLHASDGSTLPYANGSPAVSWTGPDYWKYRDPEITYNFQTAGTYYVKVTDLMDTQCSFFPNALDAEYFLLVETPDARYRTPANGTDNNFINKGEIQPARSGSTKYYMQGGTSFEPDDLMTKVEDKWPDCDGIPGTGDEGDAGYYEQCGSPLYYGAGDGKMEYFEVDDKAAIDDGEWFKGVPTNLGTTMNAEVSVIHFPGGLLMAVNYGSRIYVLRSLDGQRGLEWDLDPILLDRPAVTPRQQRGNGGPTTPVVSSGPLGFCETAPGPGGDDVWAAPGLAAWAQQAGTTSFTTGSTVINALNLPRGYPNTYGITYGSNHHLESMALVDNYSVWNGMTVINSGPDGIINTFFAPRYEAYNSKPSIFSGDPDLAKVEPRAGEPYFGPGTPDNPSIYDTLSLGYISPLGALGGSNGSAFLLGTDQWNPALFEADTTTPAAYWERQQCDFYGLASQFDKCAQGAPIDLNHCTVPGDPSTCDEPVSIYGGPSLDTVQRVLSQFRGGDYLCRDAGWTGDTVAICPSPGLGGKFGGLPEIYNAIRGDDVLAVVWDPALPYNPASPGDQLLYYRTDPWDTDAPQPLSYLAPGIITPAVLDGITVSNINSSVPSPPYKWGPNPAVGGETHSLGIDIPNFIWNLVLDGLTVPQHFPPPMGGHFEIGIDPGPDGVLQTKLVDSYTVIDIDKWEETVGGDHFCETVDHQRLAICPGIEITIDLHNADIQARDAKRLMSAWPMYLSTEDLATLDGTNTFTQYGLSQIKRDYYGLYDDYFCIVNGAPAVCPGENGSFQSYQVSEKQIVAHNDDLLALYRDVADAVGQPCYQLVSERYQDTPYQDEKTRYVLYRYFGVMQDDRIGWDPQYGGYYVSTGPNGINQSCVDSHDVQVIPFHHGLPNQPIIVPPGGGSLTTYPLADNKVQWAANVEKISTGADGIMNSYAQGDDNWEIFMGTGRPDMPCVLAGPNGVAETVAADFRTDPSLVLDGESAKWANDTQLYQPGQIAGFDAFNVWGPELVQRGNYVYLYYTGLGWDTLPDQVRDGAGALGDKGECKRPGLDFQWGRNRPDQTFNLGDTYNKLYDFTLDHFEFKQRLDNNSGVLIAPRIGVATSTVQRLALNTSDWDVHSTPALDVGRVCGGVLDFPIDLPLDVDLPGLGADVNFNGSFSPDAFSTDAPDGESPLFIMFFSGLSETEPGSDDPKVSLGKAGIGMARSLDGMHFELLRDLNPLLLSSPDFFESVLHPLINDSQYSNPTVVNAGSDEWGEPMYGMFFNQFISDLGNQKEDSINLSTWDRRKMDHIGYALRKGKVTLSSCSLAGNGLEARGPERANTAIGLILLLLPVGLVLAARLWRRRES